MTATSSSYVCEECREPIDADASTCPHCGYRPADEFEKYAKRNAIVGVILALFILGIPIAPYFLWKSNKFQQKAKAARPSIEVEADVER